MAAIRLLPKALLVFSMALASAQDLEDAMQRLSQHFGRRPVNVSWQNLSTMPAEEADRARQKFESAFEISPAGIETKATLSENPRGYLIVLQTPDAKVYTESWTRPPSKPPRPPYHLKQTRLGESPRPILDAAVSPDGQQTVLLEAFRVSSQLRSAGLPLPRPLPRDPRGRVQVSDSGEIRVQLPGVHCSGTLPKMLCSVSDDAWIVAGRNYFKGPRGPYYSSVEIDGASFESGIDGLTRMYANTNEAPRVLDGWGSELAPLDSACGAKLQLITSLETEQAQAFEYSNGRLKASTDPLPAEGPIVAIWPASDHRDQVTMVVHNRTKGTYEASRLAIACTAE